MLSAFLTPEDLSWLVALEDNLASRWHGECSPAFSQLDIEVLLFVSLSLMHSSLCSFCFFNNVGVLTNLWALGIC
jgi:hypothetical protein